MTYLEVCLITFYYVINVHEGGSPMMTYQHAVIVEKGLEQLFGSIIVDSVVAFSARIVVNKRSDNSICEYLVW